jgi:DNA-binding transcriptional ArsR family regulator
MIHVMLPIQYLRRAADRLAEPQKLLMLAVLKAVVEDCEVPVKLHPQTPKERLDHRAREQAWAYVHSTDRSWPFSFENVCEAVGLDAPSLRRGLAATRDASEECVVPAQAVTA